jgi:hypothetical protein
MAGEGNVPQFQGGGPMVLVRNTFLDFEGPAPAPSELVRSKTAPPAAGTAAESGDEDDASPAAAPAEEDASPAAASAEDEDEDQEGETPEEQDLRRTVTQQEWLEADSGWLWAGNSAGTLMQGVPQGDASAPAVAPGTIPAGGYALPYQPQVIPAGMPMPMSPEQMGMGGMGMVFMPVALGPIGGAAPMPVPDIPQMPVRAQPEKNNSSARWPLQPGPIQPQNTITVSSAAAPMQGSTSSSLGGSLPAGGAPPPQPQTLTRQFSVLSGFYRVCWTVDGRKLRGNEKQTVSPPFELSFGPDHPNVTFKMMIYPEMINEGKGGSCFRKSNGRGFVQLKCEAELPASIAKVTFRISIGSGKNMKEARGPVEHDFASSAVCGLPKDREIWDFQEVVNQNSQTFVVCLEIVPTKDVVPGQ